MEKSVKIQKLVDEYFSRIEVDYGCFVVQNKGYDATVLSIIVPSEMLEKFPKVSGSARPDGVKFWKETNLACRLRNYTGPKNGLHFLDFLDYLKADVDVRYNETSDPSKTRITISEL
jgi:hypothetical protein